MLIQSARVAGPLLALGLAAAAQANPGYDFTLVATGIPSLGFATTSILGFSNSGHLLFDRVDAFSLEGASLSTHLYHPSTGLVQIMASDDPFPGTLRPAHRLNNNGVVLRINDFSAHGFDAPAPSFTFTAINGSLADTGPHSLKQIVNTGHGAHLLWRLDGGEKTLITSNESAPFQAISTYPARQGQADSSGRVIFRVSGSGAPLDRHIVLSDGTTMQVVAGPGTVTNAGVLQDLHPLEFDYPEHIGHNNFGITSEGKVYFRGTLPSKDSWFVVTGDQIERYETPLSVIRFHLNNHNQVALLARVPGAGIDLGLYAGPDPVLDLVYRPGDRPFGPDLDLGSLTDAWINDSGQIAFATSAPLIVNGQLVAPKHFIVRADPVFRWTNPAGGELATPTNWAVNRAPGLMDKALFDLDATYTVELDRDTTVRALEVRSGHVTLAGDGVVVSAAGTSVASSSGLQELRVREVLTVAPNGIMSIPANLHVQSEVGMVDGRMFISGPTASWRATDLHVGFRADGLVDVGNGGELTAGTLRLGTGKTGTIVVNNANLIVTTRLEVGSSDGFGDVVIENGAQATLGELVMSSPNANTSKFTVKGFLPDGPASKVSVSSVFNPSAHIVIGASGAAELSIADEAQFITDQPMFIGPSNDSAGSGHVFVVGEGAKLTVPELTIGHRGSGSVHLEGGGRILFFDPALVRLGSGEPSGGTGSMLITGESLGLEGSKEPSLISGERLELHRGSIMVKRGGFAQMNSASIGDFGANASVELDGAGFQSGRLSFFFFRDELRIGSLGTLKVGSGAVLVGRDKSAGRSPGNLVVSAGGRLSGSGLIEGNLILFGGEVEFVGFVSGVVAPGKAKVAAGRLSTAQLVETSSSAGTLSIDGDFEMLSGGVLEIEIGGLLADTQHDVLDVSGDVLLGGTLVLSFIDGFAPQTGQAFSFLEVGGELSGTLAEIQVEGLLPGFEFDLNFQDSQMTMIALTDGAAIPEPASGTILVMALTLIACRRRARTTGEGGAAPNRRVKSADDRSVA